MPFEVRQDKKGIVICEMRSDPDFAKMDSSTNRQPNFPIRVENIHRCDSGKTMVAGGLEMAFSRVAFSIVGGVGIDKSSANGLHQILDQLRRKVIMSARFPHCQFDRNFSCRRATESLVCRRQTGG